MNQLPKELICQNCSDMPAIAFRYGMKLCGDCLEVKERMNANQNSLTASKLPTNPMLAHAEAIDRNITVKTDIFNAETVAIAELKKAIDDDSNIPADKKNFALAEAMQKRIHHYKQVLFDLNQQVVDESNKQRAVQQYLNQLANNLREEERAKIRALDLTYKPTSPLLTKGGKMKKTKIDAVAKVKGISREDLARASKMLGIEAATIKMLCVAKNWDIDTAIRELGKTIASAKSDASAQQ